MESKYRKGYVYIQKIFAGTIAETEEGYEFSYNEDYLKREDAVSVSLTLPLQKEAYKATVLFPFLLNLWLRSSYIGLAVATPFEAASFTVP